MILVWSFPCTLQGCLREAPCQQVFCRNRPRSLRQVSPYCAGPWCCGRLVARFPTWNPAKRLAMVLSRKHLLPFLVIFGLQFSFRCVTCSAVTLLACSLSRTCRSSDAERKKEEQWEAQQALLAERRAKVRGAAQLFGLCGSLHVDSLECTRSSGLVKLHSSAIIALFLLILAGQLQSA